MLRYIVGKIEKIIYKVFIKIYKRFLNLSIFFESYSIKAIRKFLKGLVSYARGKKRRNNKRKKQKR